LPKQACFTTFPGYAVWNSSVYPEIAILVVPGLSFVQKNRIRSPATMPEGRVRETPPESDVPLSLAYPSYIGKSAALGEADGLAEGEADGLGLSLSLGEAEGLGDSLALGLADGL